MPKNLTISKLQKLRTEIKPLQKAETLNIITSAGLEEIAKRSIILSKGGSLSKNTHCSIGIGTTLESESDTALANQIGIKEITDMGSNSGKEQYVTSWEEMDTNQTSPNITEGGIWSNTWSNDGTTHDPILMFRATTRQTLTLTEDNALTVTIDSDHTNGESLES